MLRLSRIAGDKIAGKVSHRVELLVRRSYLFRYIKKPIEQINDAEWLSVPDVGYQTLREIRKVIPAPMP